LKYTTLSSTTTTSSSGGGGGGSGSNGISVTALLLAQNVDRSLDSKRN
jgi:hypothetical protein